MMLVINKEVIGMNGHGASEGLQVGGGQHSGTEQLIPVREMMRRCHRSAAAHTSPS